VHIGINQVKNRPSGTLELDDTGLGGFVKKTCDYRFPRDRWDFKECKKNPYYITFWRKNFGKYGRQAEFLS